jgi:hypothetical protein
MKQIILLCLFFILVNQETFSQRTADELAQEVFMAFKKDSMNQVLDKRIKYEELDSFFTWLRKDIKSPGYLTYKSKYPSISKKLLDSCTHFRHDSDNPFLWREAILSKAVFKAMNAPGETTGIAAASHGLLTLTIQSGSQEILLLFEILKVKDGTWKVGNSISRFIAGNILNDD